MPMRTGTSRLAAGVVAAALAMAASPARAVVLPPVPPLPPLLPLLALPHVVGDLLRSLLLPLVVAPQMWSDEWSDPEFCGSRRYAYDYGYDYGEDRVAYMAVRPMRAPLWVAPRMWNDRGSYGYQGYAHGYGEERGMRVYRPPVPPQRMWNDRGSYGYQGYSRGEERGLRAYRPPVPPQRVAPRTWSNRGSYGAQRDTRGDTRRNASPDQGRRNRRSGERRGHGDNGNRWR